ncbi:MAG: S-layer homology domain-containing protein [Bacillota bacterium]
MELKNNRYKLLLLCLVFTFISRAAFADTGFDDVAEKDWFYKGVLYASSNKLLEDTGETAFKPASAIDRTEFIVALYKYSKIKGYDVSAGLDTNILSYDDAFNIREGAYEAFQWALRVWIDPRCWCILA